MDKTMTVQEVLEDAVKTISNISLSVAYVDTVGVQLSRVMNNLKACIECIEQKGEENGSETDSE